MAKSCVGRPDAGLKSCTRPYNHAGCGKSCEFSLPFGVYFVRARRVSWLQKQADTCCLYFILTRHISIEQELFEQRQFLTTLFAVAHSAAFSGCFFFGFCLLPPLFHQNMLHIFIARNCSLAFLCRYISLFSVIVITFLCKFRRGVYFLLRLCHGRFLSFCRNHWVVCTHRNNKLFGPSNVLVGH